jgi:hypothetical protein
MGLTAGTIGSFTGSMAEAIENAFNKAWPDAMGGQPPPQTNNQARLLYVAIAQGVCQYLAEHPEAFVLSTTFDGTNYQTQVTSITVS